MGERSRAPVVCRPSSPSASGSGTSRLGARARGGPRTLLLERSTGPDAVPLDRDLVLSADVRAFSLADLLQLVHASGKSGFLLFEHADCAKSVYLHAGEVVFATSNQRIDRLGESLLRAA